MNPVRTAVYLASLALLVPTGVVDGLGITRISVSHQTLLEGQMARMHVSPAAGGASTSHSPTAMSAASHPPVAAAAAAAVASAAAEAAKESEKGILSRSGSGADPNTCGVGIRFAETQSGEFKITQLVPDR